MAATILHIGNDITFTYRAEALALTNISQYGMFCHNRNV